MPLRMTLDRCCNRMQYASLYIDSGVASWQVASSLMVMYVYVTAPPTSRDVHVTFRFSTSRAILIVTFLVARQWKFVFFWHTLPMQVSRIVCRTCQWKKRFLFGRSEIRFSTWKAEILSGGSSGASSILLDKFLHVLLTTLFIHIRQLDAVSPVA